MHVGLLLATYPSSIGEIMAEVNAMDFKEVNRVCVHVRFYQHHGSHNLEHSLKTAILILSSLHAWDKYQYPNSRGTQPH